MADPAKRSAIPRACSDVFRLWTWVAIGALLSVGFAALLLALGAGDVTLDRPRDELRIEVSFGMQLVAWNAFALTYLVLGLRAFRAVTTTNWSGASRAARCRAPRSADGCMQAAAGRGGQSSSPSALVSLHGHRGGGPVDHTAGSSSPA